MKKLLLALGFVFLGFLIHFFSQVTLAAPPANFQTTPVVTTGLNAPSGFDIAPDGRTFILQRTGEVLIVKNGQLLPQPFAVLPSATSGDRGLIGIAFDPDFLNNHYVYFYYTSSDNLLSRLVRFDASGDVGTNGPFILYETSIPSEMLHVGGGIAFGPDGKIYIGIGDNGYHLNAQDLSNPYGKIIRLNKDGSMPTDNPFYGQADKAGEIWAYGFRNPWRLQFDPLSGRLYASDVGEAEWEEINLIVKGGNYGWPLSEGMCISNCTGQINPIYAYSHNGGSASVTGGPVYQGNMFPAPYLGSYFFGDYALGFIRYLVLDANGNTTSVNTFDPQAGSIVDLKVAPDGSLYYLNIFPSGLFQTIYTTGNHIPVVKASADTTSGSAPLTVNFSSAGTSDEDNDLLTYFWDFGDGTNSTLPNPSKTYTQNGRYTVLLKVSDGTYNIPSNPIVIQVGAPPIVTIALPSNNSNYRAGDTISYSATAVDGDGNIIPAANFTTQVVFHHQTHLHPFLGPLVGNNQGTFIIPTTGESSPEVWFEIDITVVDSFGLSTTASVQIFPLKVNLTTNTSPENFQILLDGQPVTASQTIQQVVNFQREVRPVAAQLFNGLYYQLDHWSDGGNAVHFITTPDSDYTITAFYNPMPAFSAQYFNNTSLSGAPTLTRNDSVIDFNWDGISPASGIEQNNFSVRWEKNQYFAAGRYIFTSTTDDGFRLYIDNNLVIDRWFDQGTTSYTAVAVLSTGNHSIKMEYYQAFGGAVARLTWDLTPDQNLVSTPVPTPTSTPTPSPTSVPTPPPDSGQLLTTTWQLTGNSSAAEKFQSISPTALQGQTNLALTFNTYGTCLLGGDASAIVFDQGGFWYYVSLASYGQNCHMGTQTVNIPLSDFLGLNLAAPVGNFHVRFWNSGPYTIDITSVVVSGAVPTPMPTPIPTPTPPSSGTQLLTSPWTIRSPAGGAIDSYQSISATALQGNTNLALIYDIHGLCILGGDASAIIFDQGGFWHYVSLSNYGQNCYDGTQTVNIPLADFPGLVLTSPVGTFHSRFWYPTSYAIDITSAVVSGAAAPSPTPSPSSTPAPTSSPTPAPGTELLTSPWNLSGNSGDANQYQSIDPNILPGKTTLNLTYNLHGLCALGGDASAIIFDQPTGDGWHYISLSNYGINCLDGVQTVSIPLSDFPGLGLVSPVGTFHSRFWYGGPFTVDITSATIQ